MTATDTGRASPVCDPTPDTVITLLRSIRPDWTPAAIAAAWHGQTVPWLPRLLAALRCYADPTTLHPGRLREAGPWWADPVATAGPPNLRGPDVCREHLKRLPCAGCIADAKAVPDEPEETTT